MITDFTIMDYHITKGCDDMKKILMALLVAFILMSCVRVNHKVAFENENISCDGVVRRGLFDSRFYGVVRYKDSGIVITAFDDSTGLVIDDENIISASSLSDFPFRPPVG